MFNNNIAVGSIAGTGAAINIQTGFKPKYVKVFNPNDGGSLFPSIEWWEGMAAASGRKTLKSVDSGSTGNASSAYITSGGISQFSGVMPPAAYTGTVAVAANSATITGTNTLFLSQAVVGELISIGGVTRRIVAIASNTSMTVNAAYEAAQSGITALNINGSRDGFTIGTDGDINVSGETVFYMAIG